MFITVGLIGTATADALRDRLDSLTKDISRFSLAATKGNIDFDFAGRQLDTLIDLESGLRLGTLSLDDLTLRWRDQGALPVKAPGARLIAVGLPPDFDGSARAFLDGGQELEIYAETNEDLPGQVDIYIPDHPDGPDATALFGTAWVALMILMH